MQISVSSLPASIGAIEVASIYCQPNVCLCDFRIEYWQQLFEYWYTWDAGKPLQIIILALGDSMEHRNRYTELYPLNHCTTKETTLDAESLV